MLEAIEKLLILQDRDRKISRLRSELANIGPERQALAAKTASSQAALDAAKERIKQIESDRKKELAAPEADRDQLAAAVDESVLPRYERLRKSKGENVVVGVAHGVCGGCHMKLQRQVIVTCQGNQEIVACPNCGRILYYTQDMRLVAAE